MAFIAVYDANVLYPNTLRDLLIRIAQLPQLVQAKWTEDILNEVRTRHNPAQKRGRRGTLSLRFVGAQSAQI